MVLKTEGEIESRAEKRSLPVLRSYPKTATPDGPVCKCVPQVHVLVVSGAQELVLLRVRGHGPHLVNVAGYDFVEAEFERSLEDGVSSRPEQELATLALGDRTNRA